MNQKAIEAYWNGWIGVGSVMKKWAELSEDTQNEERPDISAGLEAAAPHIIEAYKKDSREHDPEQEMGR